MNDTKTGLDRLTRGLLLSAASLSGVYAMAPLNIPVQTVEHLAFAAFCGLAYGVFLLATSGPSIATLERIVPEQYH